MPSKSVCPPGQECGLNYPYQQKQRAEDHPMLELACFVIFSDTNFGPLCEKMFMFLILAVWTLLTPIIVYFRKVFHFYLLEE